LRDVRGVARDLLHVPQATSDRLNLITAPYAIGRPSLRPTDSVQLGLAPVPVSAAARLERQRRCKAISTTGGGGLAGGSVHEQHAKSKRFASLQMGQMGLR